MPATLDQLPGEFGAAQTLAQLAGLIRADLQGIVPCQQVLLLDRHATPAAATFDQVFTDGPSVRVADLADERSHQPGVSWLRSLLSETLRSCLLVALPTRGERIGAVLVASQAKGSYTREHALHLEAMSGIVALVMQRIQLAQELQETRDEVARLKGKLELENVYLKDEIKAEQSFTSLIGDSAASQQVRRAILQVAKTDSTVLILGETGTGKELIARAIHKISPRRQHLLVKTNCAALAPGVIASELFGHEAGAFTGATKRRLGRFELAQHGSLFLDEVGEIPAETQVLLLRVLQERVIERVGGNEPIPVDVRVIAATHRDLPTAVRDGCFRADLFYRLNVFPIVVPPLRERRDDIPALVKHFVAHFAGRLSRPRTSVSPATMDLLRRYDWPGNVRELENILERALIISSGDSLQIDPTWLSAPASLPPVPGSSLAELERQAILEALERCGGKIYGPGGAAQALRLKPSTLYGKMRKLHIERKPAPFAAEDSP